MHFDANFRAISNKSEENLKKRRLLFEKEKLFEFLQKFFAAAFVKINVGPCSSVVKHKHQVGYFITSALIHASNRAQFVQVKLHLIFTVWLTFTVQSYRLYWEQKIINLRKQKQQQQRNKPTSVVFLISAVGLHWIVDD